MQLTRWQLIKTEQRALIQDQILRRPPVVGDGGRQCVQQLIVGVQRTARSFDDNVQASVGKPLAEQTLAWAFALSPRDSDAGPTGFL